MARYFVVVKPSGDEKDHLIGCDKMQAGIVEFDGTLEEATEHYTRKVLYGGDENGTPEQYNRIRRHEYSRVIVVPTEGMREGDFAIAIMRHNDWHDREDARKKEEAERAELARLKAKYST